MKKRLTRCVVGVLILGLALLAFSCGGTTTVPAEEPATSTAPAAEEPATTGGPAAISHTLEGRDDCLVCHGEGALQPFPAEHTGLTNDTCTACHQPTQ